jgi:Golgi nucleoside diphosphatase
MSAESPKSEIALLPLEQVPEALRSTTPLLLLATAGVRVLPDDMRAAVLDDVRAYLTSQCGFAAPGANDVRVLEQDLEGYYAWLSG